MQVESFDAAIQIGLFQSQPQGSVHEEKIWLGAGREPMRLVGTTGDELTFDELDEIYESH